ncbi:mitochondrial amidoxime-reducing component 1-like isoform X2 [Hyla sarda]|uniref:mitochondrial amidoxime-reducing component 1-like isoform X2 n=1 Tax=Hyla sarda TaxID=327740 RepID=UPI0024C37F9B|nr:mitochondrial amidoxime-reducing component 1-like isoform X2 [Hyla sarda]XP_056402918.1 mitochondrial amidoxime-reducing component 1-like isoform X2 [Hyla sarda]XP_056402928.1 mitochondrial amidoxime-reducing component 1-like isoform X2 [Hyla sarda]XP_056402938.1 mitochondrial amidoxime-reducing component 1-like isoform X2 [Hyla sarda]
MSSSSLSGAIESMVETFQRHRLPLLCAAGLGVTAVASWMWWRSKRGGYVELRKVGTVSQLLIYPVKSCRAVSVQEAECTELGLRHGELEDRHWLVVTEEGHMVTGRQEPRIVLISVTGCGDSICLEAPGMEKIHVPLVQPKSNKIVNCRVFSSDVQGRYCGDEVSRWLTTYFQSSSPYSLVHFEPKVMKPRKSKDAERPFRDKDVIAYPDGSPIMLLSETSLEELNRRMETPVSVANFRPCIVVSGCEAFSEDGWDDVKVGTVRMKRVMACGRCILTTVNPNTGVMTRKEPLDTLRTFRMSDESLNHLYKNAPLFGQYYGVDKTGKLRVGDPVYLVVRRG